MSHPAYKMATHVVAFLFPENKNFKGSSLDQSAAETIPLPAYSVRAQSRRVVDHLSLHLMPPAIPAELRGDLDSLFSAPHFLNYSTPNRYINSLMV